MFKQIFAVVASLGMIVSLSACCGKKACSVKEVEISEVVPGVDITVDVKQQKEMISK